MNNAAIGEYKAGDALPQQRAHARHVDLIRNRINADRYQALRAQLRARGARAVGVDQAFAGDSGCINGFVAESGHGGYLAGRDGGK